MTAPISNRLLSVHSHYSSSLATFLDGFTPVSCVGLCPHALHAVFKRGRYVGFVNSVFLLRSQDFFESCLRTAVLLDDLGGSKSG